MSHVQACNESKHQLSFVFPVSYHGAMSYDAHATAVQSIIRRDTVSLWHTTIDNICKLVIVRLQLQTAGQAGSGESINELQCNVLQRTLSVKQSSHLFWESVNSTRPITLQMYELTLHCCQVSGTNAWNASIATGRRLNRLANSVAVGVALGP